MTVAATYTAKDAIGAVSARCQELPMELHQLILWCVTHPEIAAQLLPTYYDARNDSARP